MLQLDGDAGARRLLAAHADRVREVDLGTDAIFADVDTPEALAKVRRPKAECSEQAGIPAYVIAATRVRDDSRYFLFSRAIRLEVSQRLPPIFCTSA